VTPLGPGDEAQAALASDSAVTFEQARDWITFTPTNGPPATGLIIYPGGHVEYRSYAPLARAIAASGYQVTIVKMPLSLAVFGVDRADEVMAAYPNVRSWAIGGHSLGGVMAARYASRNPGKVKGIALWAAFPADDLSHSDLKGLLTYGSRDGLLDVDKVEASRSLLPPGSVLEVIQGGNHGGFGYYGPQMGDSDAEISPEQQQAQVMELTLRLLRAVQGE
jgi:pimeloyl-ACP methyl ester carboxylesterase